MPKRHQNTHFQTKDAPDITKYGFLEWSHAPKKSTFHTVCTQHTVRPPVFSEFCATDALKWWQEKHVHNTQQHRATPFPLYPETKKMFLDYGARPMGYGRNLKGKRNQQEQKTKGGMVKRKSVASPAPEIALTLPPTLFFMPSLCDMGEPNSAAPPLHTCCPISRFHPWPKIRLS